jgi:hypothetical protein
MDKPQTQVMFDCSGTREVQYLTRLPEVGDFITRRGELWVVRRVHEDRSGTVVTCKLSTLADAPGETLGRSTV